MSSAGRAQIAGQTASGPSVVRIELEHTLETVNCFVGSIGGAGSPEPGLFAHRIQLQNLNEQPMRHRPLAGPRGLLAKPQQLDWVRLG